MRIRRLEVQGFKSFKDKTVIQFDHSVTGIVGPNGCGKSNIVDAFFWVMGEQSFKHMRGSGSEDLIFNGSSKYTPLGMAEATLVMETGLKEDQTNAPMGATVQDLPVRLRCKEISITRRVYRSGEGEYFINHVPARLKDIQELFMDTGVGAKGYSIIEQGQIGKIVNAKPEERRLLIEEAAGIAKYKARKKESLRKIEAAQANLSRLSDVLQEIKNNLDSLERQAQKARLYRKYKDELLDREMTWGRRKHKLLSYKLELFKKSRETIEQELLSLKTELQVLENNIEKDRTTHLNDTKSAEDYQGEIQRLSTDLAREQSVLESSQRRQGDLTTQLDSMAQERQTLQKAILCETVALQSLGNEYHELAHSLKSIEEKVQAMHAQVRFSRDEVGAEKSKLETFKKEWTAVLQQTSDCMAQGATLTAKIESATNLLERLQIEAATHESQKEIAKKEINKAHEALETLQHKKSALLLEKEKLHDSLKAQEEIQQGLESNCERAKQNLTQHQSRLTSLEELDSAHEGFGDAPRAILDWAKNRAEGDSGIIALTDGLEIEHGFETVVQGLFGAQLESLIGLQPHFVMEALQKIRKEKLGRASVLVGQGTFFISNCSFVELKELLTQFGFEVVGELKSFVKIGNRFPEAARPWLDPLLSHVCIVKNFSPIAQLISQKGVACLKGWSLLSMDGEALDCEGKLHGGNLDGAEPTSVLGRKRVISELTAEVLQSEESLRQLENQLEGSHQGVEKLKAEERSLEAKKQTFEIEEASLKRDLELAVRIFQDLENTTKIKFSEVHQTELALAQNHLKHQQAEAASTRLKSHRKELEQMILEHELDVGAHQNALREQEEVLQALRIDEASLRERVVSVRKSLEVSKLQISEKEKRLLDLSSSLERISQERSAQLVGDQNIRVRVSDLISDLSRVQEKLAKIKNRIEETNARINSALDHIKLLHNLSEQKNGQSTELALEAEKITGEISFLIQNLEEKYGPSCLDQPIPQPIQEEMAAPIITTDMTAEEERLLSETVEKLRERIRRLGEVNVMAIDEYDDLKKRYDHLSSEKADLEKSIENLKEAIDYINKTSEERFQKAFDAIANRFEKLFPIVFGEGAKAQLSLVYPEGSQDILEAGVDILAQPSGKKVTNISLLSGGEKALTAVALIFAIFMVKPSPFCILDEVDAPLDDANIGKFNTLLREMSTRSQFILITHNKKTMELNDTLYGVTMEEPGVSKMISIEMR